MYRQVRRHGITTSSKGKDNMQPVPPAPPTQEQPFRITAQGAQASVFLCRYGTANIIELEYRKNGENWRIWNEKEGDQVRTLELNIGEYVEIRNTAEQRVRFSYGANNRYQFFFDAYPGRVVLSGDLRSLLQKENYNDVNLMAGDFHSLFKDNGDITDVSGLILKTRDIFQQNCYQSLFANCGNLGGAITLEGLSAGRSAFTQLLSYSGFTQREGVVISLKVEMAEANTFNNWLEGAINQGVIIAPEGLLLIEESWSGVPTGWTRTNG